ncbi:MAG: ARPP-1 family domain-containing protein [Thermoguttaceae bacterium]
MRVPHLILTVALSLLGFSTIGGTASAQRPPTDRHVAELGQFLNGVKITAPIVEQRLAIYPVLVDDVPLLHGAWQTLDEAIARGTLAIHEKDGGSVPVVSVENRSKEAYILLMMGDVIKGGMQTRTVRYDTVLGPGQWLDLEVFCVEARRWNGDPVFSAANAKVPQSIQNELRRGASQGEVWQHVAGNNASLGAENATGSLEMALKSASVEEKLDAVRKRVVPEIPRGTVGFIFVHDSRAVGAEFFGREELARAEFPQLLDSYAVDYVLLSGRDIRRSDERNDNVAISFFERVCRAGSQRAKTPASGAGIRTQADGLLGDGVSLDSTLVHYGIQVERKAVPRQPGQPEIIWPPRNRSELEDLNPRF